VRLIALPLTLATAILFARLLGPEQYGLFAFSMSLAALLALPVGNGMAQLITRDIARASEVGDAGAINGVRLRSLHVLAVYSVALFLFCVLPYFALGFWSFPVAAAAVLAPILALYDINGGILRGLAQPVRSQIPLLLVRPLAVLIISIGVWSLGYLSLDIVLGVQIIASALVLILSFAYLRKALPRDAKIASPVYHDRAWIGSLPVFVMISGLSFLNVEIGVLLLGFMGEPEGASGMRVAQSAGQLAVLPLMAVNMVIQPKLATQAMTAKDRDALMQTYARGGRMALAGSLIVGLPMIVFAEHLVRLAFGEAYVALAVDAIRVMTLAQILNASTGSSGSLLAMSGNEGLAMKAQIISLILMLGIAFFLAPVAGAAGVAVGISVGLILKNVLEVVHLRRVYGRWMSAFMRAK
jgi:O-antigen/teichoic acid export membrane protein